MQIPYIKSEERLKFQDILNEIEKMILTEGELNYLITKIVMSHMNNKGKRYATLNEILGVLECIKQELYRRVVGPYEDLKIKESGDVY